MNQQWKDIILYRVDRWRTYVLVLLKWVLFAVLTGVLVGAVGAVFHIAIDEASHYREEHSWVLYLLPVCGLVIVAAYRYLGMSDDRGTEFIISAAREGKFLRIRTAILIFLSTVLTHFGGGSAGREGAALQLGGSMSNTLGRLLKLNEKDERMITMCGMAAGFAALFGTPLAAAVMAMEVVSVGLMQYSAIVPCILAALIAQQTAIYIGVYPTSFSVSYVPHTDVLLIGKLIFLAVLCALVAILFCLVMHNASRVYKRITDNPYLRVLIGGFVVILLAQVFGRDYNGAGVDVIRRAFAGEARMEAFLLKILFTAVTLAAGFKGGEIVPAFFCGATFGCCFGSLLGIPASFAAACGLVSVFCGVTNCPLTSILLSFELFGGEGLVLYALCCSVSYMVSGNLSLYDAQEIVFSKLSPEERIKREQ